MVRMSEMMNNYYDCAIAPMSAMTINYRQSESVRMSKITKKSYRPVMALMSPMKLVYFHRAIARLSIMTLSYCPAQLRAYPQ